MIAGREYSLIGWCTNRAALDSEQSLLDLLYKACDYVNMRPLKDISVHVDHCLDKLQSDKFEDEGGATATLILSTSHAAIHGWPCRDTEREDGGFFWFSLASCRDFDSYKLDRLLYIALGATIVERFERTPLVAAATKQESFSLKTVDMSKFVTK